MSIKPLRKKYFHQVLTPYPNMRMAIKNIFFIIIFFSFSITIFNFHSRNGENRGLQFRENISFMKV